MNKSFKCPFCESHFPLTNDTYIERHPSFQSDNWTRSSSITSDGESHYPLIGDGGIEVQFYKCPSCTKTSVRILGEGHQYFEDYEQWFYPSSNAKQFPEYVPQAIRSDYEEAFSILKLSSKSSATLSRRCIQGMIRDVWTVRESSLYKEIDAIKDKIDATLWAAIDALRQLGNIGAHMEKEISLIIDIEPDEAEKLLHLVEILIKEWYINPYERDLLLDSIVNINDEKQALRKP